MELSQSLQAELIEWHVYKNGQCTWCYIRIRRGEFDYDLNIPLTMWHSQYKRHIGGRMVDEKLNMVDFIRLQHVNCACKWKHEVEKADTYENYEYNSLRAHGAAIIGAFLRTWCDIKYMGIARGGPYTHHGVHNLYEGAGGAMHTLSIYSCKLACNQQAAINNEVLPFPEAKQIQQPTYFGFILYKTKKYFVTKNNKFQKDQLIRRDAMACYKKILAPWWTDELRMAALRVLCVGRYYPRFSYQEISFHYEKDYVYNYENDEKCEIEIKVFDDPPSPWLLVDPQSVANTFDMQLAEKHRALDDLNEKVNAIFKAQYAYPYAQVRELASTVHRKFITLEGEIRRWNITINWPCTIDMVTKHVGAINPVQSPDEFIKLIVRYARRDLIHEVQQLYEAADLKCSLYESRYFQQMPRNITWGLLFGYFNKFRYKQHYNKWQWIDGKWTKDLTKFWTDNGLAEVFMFGTFDMEPLRARAHLHSKSYHHLLSDEERVEYGLYYEDLMYLDGEKGVDYSLRDEIKCINLIFDMMDLIILDNNLEEPDREEMRDFEDLIRKNNPMVYDLSTVAYHDMGIIDYHHFREYKCMSMPKEFMETPITPGEEATIHNHAILRKLDSNIGVFDAPSEIRELCVRPVKFLLDLACVRRYPHAAKDVHKPNYHKHYKEALNYYHQNELDILKQRFFAAYDTLKGHEADTWFKMIFDELMELEYQRRAQEQAEMFEIEDIPELNPTTNDYDYYKANEIHGDELDAEMAMFGKVLTPPAPPAPRINRKRSRISAFEDVDDVIEEKQVDRKRLKLSDKTEMDDDGTDIDANMNRIETTVNISVNTDNNPNNITQPPAWKEFKWPEKEEDMFVPDIVSVSHNKEYRRAHKISLAEMDQPTLKKVMNALSVKFKNNETSKRKLHALYKEQYESKSDKIKWGMRMNGNYKKKELVNMVIESGYTDKSRSGLMALTKPKLMEIVVNELWNTPAVAKYEPLPDFKDSSDEEVSSDEDEEETETEMEVDEEDIVKNEANKKKN